MRLQDSLGRVHEPLFLTVAVARTTLSMPLKKKRYAPTSFAQKMQCFEGNLIRNSALTMTKLVASQERRIEVWQIDSACQIRPRIACLTTLLEVSPLHQCNAYHKRNTEIRVKLLLLPNKSLKCCNLCRYRGRKFSAGRKRTRKYSLFFTLKSSFDNESTVPLP